MIKESKARAARVTAQSRRTTDTHQIPSPVGRRHQAKPETLTLEWSPARRPQQQLRRQNVKRNGGKQEAEDGDRKSVV